LSYSHHVVLQQLTNLRRRPHLPLFAARYGKQAREAATQRLRGHESVRQDEERGTWSPNQFTVEQVRAVSFASVSTVGV